MDAVLEHHEQSSHIDESMGRYVAYTAQLRTLLATGTRYLAYSSEIGEAFRPIARPILVTAAYGVSWAYIFGDVGYNCWNASKTMDSESPHFMEDLGWIAARRGVFQTLARCVQLWLANTVCCFVRKCVTATDNSCGYHPVSYTHLTLPTIYSV